MNSELITQNDLINDNNDSIFYEFDNSLDKTNSINADHIHYHNWFNRIFDREHLLEDVSTYEIVFRSFGALLCILIIITTIVGNVLVIVVVTKFHRMRTVTNILLASLAFSDITVACLVMPFTIIYDFIRFWPWGTIACHFWISCDVMCCTASILHLCCVAIDRFWAITRPLRYRTYISKRRLFCCISIIWFCSAAISFIPIFTGWYHSEKITNIFLMTDVSDCSLKVNRVYALVSSLTSFYLPLPIMFYVYFRILLVAEKQSREIKQLELSLQQNGLLCESDATSANSDTFDAKRHVERSLRRRTKQLITDTKAIRTLGIVMGVFCLCWLPFFIMYVISAYCVYCDISYETRTGITWLGYINSALNPAIYAYLNKEFKTAFRRVLCCFPRMVFEGDRDAVMDEISTTSRSLQRNLDRLHVNFDVPLSPALMSRTPSATPDTTQWPIIANNSLNISSSDHSRNPSISTHYERRNDSKK
ncbi:beta-2 adrenergic receptor-like [Oppia nitens]|uniref:beta-2 adrenergic receptor-like n=1 Tax=Oppia nitens TaxID=1686743 RepID=UPI0023DACBFA|nr:beta-2 adrenergic receptor-like [Oppia nitens]